MREGEEKTERGRERQTDRLPKFRQVIQRLHQAVEIAGGTLVDQAEKEKQTNQTQTVRRERERERGTNPAKKDLGI